MLEALAALIEVKEKAPRGALASRARRSRFMFMKPMGIE